MADSDRLSRLTQATAERESKLVLAGDAAQLSSIGAGGLFKELEGKVPTAELTEVHRANHEWERNAWEQIRAGEPGPALAQYQAHDRLHIHDTRAQAAEAMVENWDQTRRSSPDGQAVMITDASNKERDQINAMAQERRAQAGELGAHRVELPEQALRPRRRRRDHLHRPTPHPRPETRRERHHRHDHRHQPRREPGHDQDQRARTPRRPDRHRASSATSPSPTPSTSTRAKASPPRRSGILTGGWQTDREHTYVAVSRAREQTQIYLSREDLGEQGLDTDAIERLAERMQHSRAQEATITKQLAEQKQAAERDQPLAPDQAPERAPEQTPERTQQAEPDPQDPQIRERDLGEIIREMQDRQRDWEQGIDAGPRHRPRVRNRIDRTPPVGTQRDEQPRHGGYAAEPRPRRAATHTGAP